MNIKARINTSDNETADTDLIFNIYDDGTLFHTTGSATNDADVSIVGNIVTIVAPTTPGQDYLQRTAKPRLCGHVDP